MSIRSALGIGTVDPGQRAGIVASLPSNPEAARLYSEGVARLRQYDALEARNLLVRAAEADPSSPMIFSSLAEAWKLLGYEKEALGAAERALELSEDLELEQRTKIAADHQMIANNWDQAAASFRSLWTFFPDNLSYGLMLVDAEIAAGDGGGALETVGELRQLPAPDSQDPRIDLAEAAVWNSLGDPGQQLAAARQAVAASVGRGSRRLSAEGRLEEATALINLGRYDEAAASCREALDFFVETENLKGVAVTRERLALIAYHRGDLATSETEIREALRVGRTIGSREVEAGALNLLGL